MQIATWNSAVKTQVSKLHKFIKYLTSNYCESTMSIVPGGHYIVMTKTNTNFFHEIFSKWECVCVCVFPILVLDGKFVLKVVLG